MAEGMVAPQVFGALQAVSGLQRGRSAARETEPVKPVPMAHVDAVRPFVSRQVWALIQLQLLTGARGGELVNLCAVDFDTSGPVWTVTLDEHKTRHRGRERVIYFGPKAQAVVRAFMVDCPLDTFLFSPQAAQSERSAEAPAHRRPGQKPTCFSCGASGGSVIDFIMVRDGVDFHTALRFIAESCGMFR